MRAPGKAAIKELQEHRYDVPDYADAPVNDAEKAFQARFAKSSAAP